MQNKNKRAVVTGGAGFIGSHMVDLLLAKKFKVYVIDNLSGGHKKNLLHHKNNRNLNFEKKDICEIKKNHHFFKNADFVFHFAGIGDIVPSIETPTDYMNTNIQGTIKVLEAARFNKVKKFVYAASSSCYGLNSSRINENGKIDTKYPYALSKYLGEQSTLHWNKVYGLPVNSIRIFNAYGTRVRTTGAYGAVFGVFLKQKIQNQPLTIIGNGKQSRDFVYVTDVAEAFYLAAKTKISGKIYNLGNDNPKSVNMLANLIGGKKTFIPDRPGEPKRTWANISRIKKDLKWKPKINFKQGVKKMLKNIDDWNDAPLWNPKSIKGATKIWFKYMGKSKA
jgi:UDP-glucose 4-epimerase